MTHWKVLPKIFGDLKGQLKKKTNPSFTHPHVIANLYDFLS